MPGWLIPLGGGTLPLILSQTQIGDQRIQPSSESLGRFCHNLLLEQGVKVIRSAAGAFVQPVAWVYTK